MFTLINKPLTSPSPIYSFFNRFIHMLYKESTGHFILAHVSTFQTNHKTSQINFSTRWILLLVSFLKNIGESCLGCLARCIIITHRRRRFVHLLSTVRIKNPQCVSNIRLLLHTRTHTQLAPLTCKHKEDKCQDITSY